MKVTKIDQKGIDLITSFEGLKLKPYLCSAKVPTIGYGTTRYYGGNKVTLKDPAITKAEAIKLFQSDVSVFERAVDAVAIDTITQNQFNALVSFAYNLGSNALKGSTLLKRVNLDPNDPLIMDEFLKWIYAGGVKLTGLVRRRKAEGDLYFSK